MALYDTSTRTALAPLLTTSKVTSQMNGAQVLHVISTKPQYYHSVRIDQHKQRAVHVLPEKYQFCSLGASLVNSPLSKFGSCTAKVHYGICSDFDVFVVDHTLPSGQSDCNPSTSLALPKSQYIYSVRTPSVHSTPNPVTVPMPVSPSVSQSLSPPDRSIVARFESYRDNIGAALELLNDNDEEAPFLEDLIRNFVREDRRRQGSQQQTSRGTLNSEDLEQQLLRVVASSSDSVDSKGRKILLKKSQADALQKLHDQKAVSSGYSKGSHCSGAVPNGDHSGDIVFLSTTREGVVNSRLVRFTSQTSRNSRESSPALSDTSSLSTPNSVLNGTNDVSSSDKSANTQLSDKTVFGISPKSSSLSRYKNLIESRSGNSSPVNFGIGVELSNLNCQPHSNSPDLLFDTRSRNADLSGQNASVPYAANAANSQSANYPSYSSSAFNLESNVAKQMKKNQELRLEISPNSNLDPSHFTTPSSWQHQPHSAPVGFMSSISGGVIDTTKCIGATTVAATGSRNSTLTPSASSYLSPKLSPSSSLPVSTTSVQHQPTFRDSSSSLGSNQCLTSDDHNLHHSRVAGYHQVKPIVTSQPTLQDSNPNSIDTFIKENEKFFESGNKVSTSAVSDKPDLLYDSHEDNQTDNHSCDGYENMKIQSNKLSSLTDDEKALLHETLKVGLYGVTGNPKKRQQMLGCQENGLKNESDTDSSCDLDKPQLKPSRRIILVSKPVPKPEPKPEPKYVNGKVVFGQMPVKPVLQKGSVAERVMLFEKCPEKTSVTKNKLNELQKNRVTSPNKIGNWFRSSDKSADKESKSITASATVGNTSTTPTPSSASTKSCASVDEPKSPISAIPIFRRFSRSNSLTGTLPGQLPRFHYPNGRPYSSHEVETQIKKIIGVFERFPSRTVTRKELGGVLKLVGIPVYWKEPLFCSVLANSKDNATPNGTIKGFGSGRRSQPSSRSNSIDLSNGKCLPTIGSKKEFISCEQFTDYWKKVISSCYDDASRFVKILTQGKRGYIIPEDFEPLIQDVIDTHPGLLFLKEAEEFHSRYVHTVIARIFYCLDKTWSGTITMPELRKSNFLKVLQLLEEEDDINQITEYFSYEHFYVIYCKFWELDQDHDLFISKFDLSRHNDSALSSRMIDRIFSGAVTRVPRNNDNQMSYAEFVWFLLSEEDKRHPRAIEYWFRCMDLDGDGCLSMYELEYFYSEQVRRMEAAGIEALPFTDCLCQMIDLVSPKDPLRITLNDLKRCRLTPIFFDTFFNLEKYLDHEQRDPFACQRDEDGLSMSDWDRYAAEEYELLVAEENAQNSSNRFCSNGQPLIEYADDDEVNDESDNSTNDSDEDQQQNQVYCHQSIEEHFDNEADKSDECTSGSEHSTNEDASEDDTISDSGDSFESPLDRSASNVVDSEVQSHQTKSRPNTCIHSGTSHIEDNNNLLDIVNFDEDIGKEFYEYLYNEFPEDKLTQDSKRPTIQLIDKVPLNCAADRNNNPFDDDDFF